MRVAPSAVLKYKETMARSVLSGLEDAADYNNQGQDPDFEEEDEEEEQGDVLVEEEAEEEAPEWKKSKARDYLFQLCLNPNFPSRDQIKPKDVWEKDPWKVKDVKCFKWFQDYKALDFASKLRQARARAEKKTGRAREDAEALKHDRLIFPEREEDFRGEPIWQGSKAQELLRRDLKKEERMKLKPKQLQKEEDEYLLFSLENFRNRIYTERKAMQRIVYIKKKRAAKEAKRK